MPTQSISLESLALTRITPHPEHLPRAFGEVVEDQNLLRSIDRFGILCPLIVCAVAENRYRILDGHRRYLCATTLGLVYVYAQVLPPMTPAEYAYRRFLIHDAVLPWAQAAPVLPAA